MTTRNRQAEAATAVEAARRAAGVCRQVQRRLVPEHAASKADRSPVTAADLASQAVVCAALAQAFPADAVVGEEASASLLGESGEAMRSAAVEAVGAAMGRAVTLDEVAGWIDHGSRPEPPADRFWTLDPIDGTKGFLRRGQYAVALALVESGRVVLGVLACPELEHGAGERGEVLLAVRGGGTTAMALGPAGGLGRGRPARVRDVAAPAEARLCESVESGHSDQSASVRIARRLGIAAEPLRMDSQAKYAAIALGQAQAYLRLPTRGDYRECIWDHAAGMIVVEEAGGRVTDVEGKALDFSRGRRLEGNRGIVATSGGIHDRVLEAVAAELVG